ncbi:MAG: hypothetical protein NT030_03970 [Candidatus Saganbacteria bacterium]|nr:hypothetical protein [Candidatus Saganbacteria bacterium]
MNKYGGKYMKSFIKSLVPLILLCFISTSLVGGAWGEGTIRDEMYLFTYDEYAGPAYESGISNPEASTTFELSIRIWYNNEQVENLEIVQPVDFKLIKSYIDSGLMSPFLRVNYFILESPSKVGNYTCNIKGTTKEGIEFMRSVKIKVIEKNIWSEKLGTIVGIVLVVGFFLAFAIKGNIYSK